MSNVLTNLKPYSVFKFFEEISYIPRGSGNEKAISDYLVKFAKDRNLEVIQDSANNVIIKKNGTPGYENTPTVVIQGHMDMVCEKNSDTEHDFEKDPLKLYIEGDMVRAKGTTLGADNGIAVAYAMALLDSNDIPHPPLEVLITTDEETGMTGAMAVEKNSLNGRILINIDNEEEGQLLVSCAGGLRTKVVLPIKFKKSQGSLVEVVIKVRGLKGGHSGMDIDKGRANSNKLLGRILVDILDKADFKLKSISGGSKNNAIPREADCHIYIKEENIKSIEDIINNWNNTLKNEFRTVEPDLNILFEVKEKIEGSIDILSEETKEKAIKLLYLIPNGIETMSQDIEGLVQSSTNLGVVTTNKDAIEFDSAVRSSIGSLKEDILIKTKLIGEAFGAEVLEGARYPEWQYNKDSKIREICKSVYRRLYGKDPEIVAIHAGVECGLFKEKFEDMDMISFGPNLYDVHTPEEKLSISSTERTWNYLLEVLKEIK